MKVNSSANAADALLIKKEASLLPQNPAPESIQQDTNKKNNKQTAAEKKAIKEQEKEAEKLRKEQEKEQKELDKKSKLAKKEREKVEDFKNMNSAALAASSSSKASRRSSISRSMSSSTEGINSLVSSHIIKLIKQRRELRSF